MTYLCQSYCKMLYTKIKDEEIDILREFYKDGIHYIEVKRRNRGCIYPKCARFVPKVKGYKKRVIIHDIYANGDTRIIYLQRRFICPDCKTTKMEDDPFSSIGSNISDYTILCILDDLKRYNHPFLEIAQKHKISATMVQNIFDTYVDMKRLYLPEVISIDEFYFSRKSKKKYRLAIMNFYNMAIIDILKDRDKATLLEWLRDIDIEERKRVKYVTIDMNDIYRDVIYRRIPEATVIADSFHVVKYVAKALDDVRKRIMFPYRNDHRSDEYHLLKYHDDLLYVKDTNSKRFLEARYSKHFHMYLSNHDKLIKLLNIHHDLKDAYELYHAYVRFNNRDFNDLIEAMNELEILINDFSTSPNREFNELALTLENWKAEICNSFIRYKGRRLSNGPMEKRNDLIKKIVKIGNGYANFERFRNRAMYCLNTLATHNYPIKLDDLKD